MLADEWLNGVPSAVGQGTRSMAGDSPWIQSGYNMDIIVDITWI